MNKADLCWNMLFQNRCHGTHKHIMQTSLSAIVSSGVPVPPQSSLNVCAGALQLCMCTLAQTCLLGCNSPCSHGTACGSTLSQSPPQPGSAEHEWSPHGLHSTGSIPGSQIGLPPIVTKLWLLIRRHRCEILALIRAIKVPDGQNPKAI